VKLDPSKLRGRRLVFLVAACVAILAGAGSVLATAGHRNRGPLLPDLSGVRVASRSDATLGRVVARLAHRKADVRCWSHADWNKRAAEYSRRWPEQPLGPWSAYTTYSPALTVNLSPAVCIELTRLARRSGPLTNAGPPEALAKALQVLTRESAHVAGFLDEATAECYGMQLIRAAAVGRGRTPREGGVLAELYWKRWYTRDDRADRSSECRNGGALDLHPRIDLWP